MWRSEALFLTANARSSVMSIYNPWCDPRSPGAPACRTGTVGACKPRAKMPRPHVDVIRLCSTTRSRGKTCARGLPARRAPARRDPEAVRLVAVSKTFPAEAVRAVHALGQREFGENYVQEGVRKMADLADLTDIAWHLDRAVAKQQGRGCRVVVCLGANRRSAEDRDRAFGGAAAGTRRRSTSASRSTPAANRPKAASRRPKPSNLGSTVAALPGLRLRGIMGIPEPSPDVGLAPAQFRVLRECFDACLDAGLARGHAVDGDVGRSRGRDRRRRDARARGNRDLRSARSGAAPKPWQRRSSAAATWRRLSSAACSRAVPPSPISGSSSRSPKRAARLAARFAGAALLDACTREAFAGAALVVLAVKPQQMREAAAGARAASCPRARAGRAVDRRRHTASRSRALA